MSTPVIEWFSEHAPKLAASPLIGDVPVCSFAKCVRGVRIIARGVGYPVADAPRIASEFYAWWKRERFVHEFFGEVVVVNLRRRRDRLQQFRAGLPADWPLPAPQVIRAVDGRNCKPPAWWGGRGGGAWGCYRSHLQVIEAALNQGSRSVLIFEDDAVFRADFAAKLTQFLRRVPKDWGMLYLGGQHLQIDQRPPVRVNDQVWRPFNVNRTHAFAIHRRALLPIYQHLVRSDWSKGHHIDHHLGRLHGSGRVNVYCPPTWLVGQAAGQSNIAGRNKPETFWQPAATAARDPGPVPFVAVVGLHSSGSSAIAGLLWHLGVHLGGNLIGYYGRRPGERCGYEAEGLAALCERAAPFPGTDYKMPRGKIWSELRNWINGRRREAATRGTIAGGKYPQLARFGDQLRNIVGERLLVVSCERSIEASIESMVRRTGKPRPVIEAHQRWLERGRRDLVQALPAERVLAIDYDAAIDDPRLAVAKLCDFLPITPTREQVEAAIASIDPKQRHVAA